MIKYRHIEEMVGNLLYIILIRSKLNTKYGIWGENMKILLIDDDLTFSRRFRQDFLNYFGEDVDFIIETQYHLIDCSDIDVFFLAIKKNEQSSLQIAKAIRDIQKDPLLIFVSEDAQLVFEALSVGTFQFIRKGNYEDDIKVVFPQLKSELERRIYTVNVECNGRTLAIVPSRIEYFIVLDHELIIEMNDQEIVLRSTVKNALALFHYPHLVQIRRGTVINLDFIDVLNGHEVSVKGKTFTISRKYYLNFKEVFEHYKR